jgi:ABC-2 type transport system permease protein
MTQIEPLSVPLQLSALGTLFRLTLRQLARGKRLLLLSFLFLLPSILAIVLRATIPEVTSDKLEPLLIFFLIPHALIPLTALLYGTAIIQDEIEEQTLTYLLVRPLPRWALYVTKLLAALLLTALLVAIFTLVTFVAMYAGTDALFTQALLTKAMKVIALLCLALVAYGSLFACVSLFVRWALVLGIGYVIVFEGVFANIDFAIRKLTVMYYFRVLAERWIGLDMKAWKIELEEAPTSQTCVLVLLGAAVFATLLAALTFAGREFHVKTPEGS